MTWHTGAPPTPHSLSPGELERIRALREDGVPIKWIAEDLGRSTTTVTEHAPRGPEYDEMAMEWKRVWPQIRRNPILRALHDEFSQPKREDTVR